MQIPILNGVYTDESADFRTSYPVNMVPVPKENGISKGYLRPADGIVDFATGPGIDRGGISWNGTCYRAMGTKLISISPLGAVTTIGNIGGSGQVRFDYSFDYLAIASGGDLFLYDGVTLSQNVDPDLGTVVDVVWVDGYFMTTDGNFLVVTELNSPFSVNPLKYGSSEIDPDPVIGLLKLHNEIYALNRYTIEVFDNIGGENFPFQRIDGAQIQRGVIGTFAACVYEDKIAFLGSGKNEPPGVYIGISGQDIKISTREIDQILRLYDEADLELVVLEERIDKGHTHLWISLPDRTLVYDSAASNDTGVRVWHVLTSSLSGFSIYRAKNLVWCYGKWIVGDPTSTKVGYLSDALSTHYGADVRWEFGTTIIYNQGSGAIVHNLELVGLTGRVDFGSDPRISTSYSEDGETWSQSKSISAGKTGNRKKRLVWLQQGAIRNWRVQRFQGDSQAFMSFARLEATVEPLAF